MPDLFVRTGEDEGKTFSLDKEVVSIGRNKDNDIVLQDAATSRSHAEIRKKKGLFFITDHGSTHGTFVNEQRNTKEVPLKHDDVIRIGNTELVFSAKGNDEVPEGASGLTLAGGETIAFRLPTDTRAAGMGLSAHHLAMLSRVAEAIQSVFELNNLLDILMDMLFEVFKPDRGVILLREDEENLLTPKIVRPEGEEPFYSHTVVDHAISEQMSLLVGDLAEDSRFNAAESIMAQSIQSAICAPLVSQNTVHGVVYLDAQNRVMSYQKEDLSLLNIIAANAGIAIANAKLVQAKVEAERLAAVGVAVAGISHYVKNILTGIKGTSQLVEMGIKTTNMKVITESWPIMMRSMQKISVLVQDMLSYSKKRKPQLEKGNLNEVVQEVYDNQKDRASELSVELLIEKDETLPDSLFESKAICDALLNIVGNAVEACSETPDARVRLVSRTSRDKTMVQALVIDNGPGIPEEMQQRIFEPFFSTKGSKGTGLGLAVSRKSVEEHGGQMILTSKIGEGTTFKISLPVDPAAKPELEDTK
ncbi:MAG: ATP-binding protein, partial [Candidatus Sumerlaeia bacterium]